MLKNVPIKPKVLGGPLKGIIIGRLSQAKATEEQTEQTIESSYAVAEKFLADIYKGPAELRHLGEQISGMVADRATILEAMELIESGDIDVVLAEDLSRIYRNPRHQYIFVQDCVDAGTRLICVADVLDTADENWEMMLGAATLRHGLHVPDTRRRVRRTATHVFHNGGMVLKVKAFYRKLTLEEAASGEFGPKGLRIAKAPNSTTWVREIRRLLIETRSPAKVVNWLNEENVPTGPYVEDDIWKPGIFKSFACDPQLHGTRLFRKTTFTPIYRTGKYRKEKNPQPEREYVPELAYMTLDEQESMLAAVGWKIDWGGTEPSRKSPRKNVSRYRSIWPGQAATCAICEGPMLIYGDFLKCKNSQKANGCRCWNRVQVDLQRTRDTVLDWLLEQLAHFSEARRAMVDAAWYVTQQGQKEGNNKASQKQKEVRELEKRQSNLSHAISMGGELEGLLRQLKDVEGKLDRKRLELKGAISESEDVTAYHNRQDVDADANEVMRFLLATSYDFADVMREFFPVFVIQPIRSLDSRQIYPRGKLQFGANVPGEDVNEPVEVMLDLFKVPGRIRLMPKAVAARSRTPKPTYRQIAPDLGTSYMTVKRSLGYRRVMDELGVTEPFVEISEKPDNAPRWGTRNRTTK